MDTIPAIRTAARGRTHAAKPNVKLIVRVLQDVIARESFASYPLLSEALKQRCAALKISYDADAITAAIAQIERGGRRRLVNLAIVAKNAPPTQTASAEHPPLSRQEASRLYAKFTRMFASNGPLVPAVTAPAYFPMLVEVL